MLCFCRNIAVAGQIDKHPPRVDSSLLLVFMFKADVCPSRIYVENYGRGGETVVSPVVNSMCYNWLQPISRLTPYSRLQALGNNADQNRLDDGTGDAKQPGLLRQWMRTDCNIRNCTTRHARQHADAVRRVYCLTRPAWTMDETRSSSFSDGALCLRPKTLHCASHYPVPR